MCEQKYVWTSAYDVEMRLHKDRVIVHPSDSLIDLIDLFGYF